MTDPTTHHPADDGPNTTPSAPSTNGQTPLVTGNREAHVAITLIRRLVSRPRLRIGSKLVVLYVCTVVVRLVGAGLLVWVAAIHLDLWSEGYRQIPTDGPLFLVDAIGGFALAAILLAWPRPLAGLLGAGFMASTLAGLILSINVGLFGFQESIGASFVVESILLESIGAVAILTWTVIVLQVQPTPRSGGRDLRSDVPAGESI
jgi:hypothetical protein